MNAIGNSRRSSAILAAKWRSLTWQRLPAGRLPIRRPGREAVLFLTYALFYIALSGLTGLVIRHHPRPVLGASYFTSDVAYVVGFKLVGLLLVPLALVRALGYRLRDVFAGDQLDGRTIVGMILAFGVGACLNQRHWPLIAGAAGQFQIPALVGRIALGLLIPLFTAALPEEIVYRGLLQPRLERVAGRIVGVLGTAVLFTAWHLPSRFVLANGVEGNAGDFSSVLLGMGVPAFVVGLIFGLLYDRYRRLLPLIAAHWGIDGVVYVSAMLGQPL